MMKHLTEIWLVLIFFFPSFRMAAASWQQQVAYVMDIEFDEVRHQYAGEQKIVYINNSPDTITQVFYHLYFNAFRPGSEMDLHARSCLDPDGRLLIISELRAEEQGALHILRLTQDGKPLMFAEDGTILEVSLSHPIYPGDSAQLECTFQGQVPLMIRRSGRYNEEGIAYSMGQWYPRICAYDADGWHPDPYVGREFYGDFGSFDVTIHMDARFTLAATGILQNPNQIGHGYQEAGIPEPSHQGKIAWRFLADRVHDFVWAADPDYQQIVFQRENGVLFRFFFAEQGEYRESWEQLPGIMQVAADYIDLRFGQYPYPEFSFIQGGDHGMEYPMATLFTGRRSLRRLVEVAVHEYLHSWYQGALGNNELLHAWMDEGFTEYAEMQVMMELERRGVITSTSLGYAQGGAYQSYYEIVSRRLEEPLSTHANDFVSNYGYTVAAYWKGSIALYQLEYLIGKNLVYQGLQEYFDTWKFRHPEPRDFFTIMERQSGLVLDWYYQFWILSTKTISYGITAVEKAEGKSTFVELTRKGFIPMPTEIEVVLTNDEVLHYYVPLDLMRGVKQTLEPERWTVLPAWQASGRTYQFEIPVALKKIRQIRLDPERLLADVNQEDNVWQAESMDKGKE